MLIYIYIYIYICIKLVLSVRSFKATPHILFFYITMLNLIKHHFKIKMIANPADYHNIKAYRE